MQEYSDTIIKRSRILVIDDDPCIPNLITAMLNQQGFTIYQACDGKDGLKNAYELHPDLIVLDVTMPGMNGWDVCARIRELSDVPVLMLTARTAEADVLRGFKAGADDYVKKPFSTAELEARIHVLLRRKKVAASPDVNHYSDDLLHINLETRMVEREGKILDLSATEYSLLACLVRNMGRIVTHRQLLKEVWGSDYGKMSTSLTLYIYYLRKKLEDSRHSHQYIHTQWGRGYYFVPIKEI